MTLMLYCHKVSQWQKSLETFPNITTTSEKARKYKFTGTFVKAVKQVSYSKMYADGKHPEVTRGNILLPKGAGMHGFTCQKCAASVRATVVHRPSTQQSLNGVLSLSRSPNFCWCQSQILAGEPQHKE